MIFAVEESNLAPAALLYCTKHRFDVKVELRQASGARFRLYFNANNTFNFEASIFFNSEIRFLT